jgi:D-alanine transaminase/branched-chain amino acid aminotransferase
MILPFALKEDKVLPLDQVKVSAADLAVCRGYGVFDFFDVQNGVPLFLQHYLDRFRRSASGLRLELRQTDAQIRQWVDELLQANQVADCGIRLLLTGGFSAGSYKVEQPSFFMLAYAPSVYEETVFKRGVRLMTQPFMRIFPEIKSINYLHGLYMQDTLKEKGYDYLLYHFEGRVLESDRSNFFLLDQNNVLYTAEEGVLHGVTRKIVLEIATEMGLKVERRAPTMQQLFEAKACFLTNTTAKLLPVRQIDHYLLPACPGEVFVELRRNFALLIQAEVMKGAKVS